LYGNWFATLTALKQHMHAYFAEWYDWQRHGSDSAETQPYGLLALLKTGRDLRCTTLRLSDADPNYQLRY
jgi:hypothetical protein